MTELQFQNLLPVAGKQNPLPRTIASATTIAPTTFVTYVSGTLQIATITPPIEGAHMLCLVFTDGSPGTMLTTGNISVAVVPTSALPTLMVYNPLTQKYTGGTLNLT